MQVIYFKNFMVAFLAKAAANNKETSIILSFYTHNKHALKTNFNELSKNLCNFNVKNRNKNILK